jgi:hypothetical protein
MGPVGATGSASKEACLRPQHTREKNAREKERALLARRPPRPAPRMAAMALDEQAISYQLWAIAGAERSAMLVAPLKGRL